MHLHIWFRIHEDVIFLLQLNESFSEVLFSKKYEILLVQIHYVILPMGLVFLFFSVYGRTLCSLLAEQTDAEEIDSSQLCVVHQEELACYKAKK